MENTCKKKILFLGMPDMAIVCLAKLAEEDINIVGVVPPHKSEATYTMMCRFAQSFGYELISYENELTEPDFLEKIRALDADLAIVCSYNKKFPKELLECVKGGFVNCHPSLLPEYRGANPYSNVIINGEKETGITLHYMDSGFDTGDIIRQQPVTISYKETMGTLFNKMNYISAEMIAQFLKDYETLDTVPCTPQPQGEFKKAPNIDAAKLQNYIKWNNPAEYLERFVRGLNPFINAMTTFRGIYTKIYSADAVKKQTQYEPGTICSVKDTLGVATADGILFIKSLQFGSYMIADAKEFIDKFKPQTGEKFE